MATATRKIQQLRRAVFRRPEAARQDLRGRFVIVTGAAPNSIGYETARQLLEQGASVTVTRRRESSGLARALADAIGGDAVGRVQGRDLDLASGESVEAFARAYAQAPWPLDVLVNCAGIHLDLLSQWKEPRLSDDGFEIHWRTNYLGTTHLTRRLLPLLLERAETTGNARVVNVVSMLHSRGRNADFFASTRPYSSWDAYGQSKLGLVHFANQIERRHGTAGLHGYSLHPGEVFTNVADAGLAGNRVLLAVRSWLAPVEAFFLMTPFEGAQSSLYCATAPEAEGGLYYRNCCVSSASPEADDAEIAARLWDENEAWVASLSPAAATAG